MSMQPGSNHGEAERLDLRAERQLDYALGRLARDEVQDLAPAELREAEDLRHFLSGTSARLRSLDSSTAESSSKTQAAIASIRGAARRAIRPADLSWRGEAGSWWRLLQGGLRTSPLLRFAAASLVLHLGALPVLAWLHYNAQPERSINLHFEQPREILTSEPQPELIAPVAIEDLEVDLIDGDVERPGHEAVPGD